MRDERDNPGVVAPPPLLFGGTLAIGLLIDFLAGPIRSGASWIARDGLATVCVAVAATLVAGAFTAMRRARTNVEPWKPTMAIVTGGVYRFTRNPIYLGMALVYAAVAIAADSGIAFLLLVPLLTVVDRLVIAREERYLAQKFGAAYLGYRGAIRRWV